MIRKGKEHSAVRTTRRKDSRTSTSRSAFKQKPYGKLNLIPVPRPQPRRILSRRPLHRVLAELKYHRACVTLKEAQEELQQAGNQMHAARVEDTIKNTRQKIEKYSHFNTMNEKDVSDDEDDGEHTTPPNLKDILGEDEPSDSLFTSSSSFELFPMEDTFMSRIMREINTDDEDEQNTNDEEEETNRTQPYVSYEEEEVENMTTVLNTEEKQRRALEKTVEYIDDDSENDS